MECMDEAHFLTYEANFPGQKQPGLTSQQQQQMPADQLLHSWAGIWTLRMRHQDQLLLAGACSAANHSWAGIWTLRMLEKINQLLFLLPIDFFLLIKTRNYQFCSFFFCNLLFMFYKNITWKRTGLKTKSLK